MGREFISGSATKILQVLISIALTTELPHHWTTTRQQFQYNDSVAVVVVVVAVVVVVLKSSFVLLRQ